MQSTSGSRFRKRGARGAEARGTDDRRAVNDRRAGVPISGPSQRIEVHHQPEWWSTSSPHHRTATQAVLVIGSVPRGQHLTSAIMPVTVRPHSRHFGGHWGTFLYPGPRTTPRIRGSWSWRQRISGYIPPFSAQTVGARLNRRRDPKFTPRARSEAPKFRSRASSEAAHAQKPRKPPLAAQAPAPGVIEPRMARALSRHRSTGGSSNSAPRADCSASTAMMTEYAAASSSSVGLPATMRMPAAGASVAGVGCSITAECFRASWAEGLPACP